MRPRLAEHVAVRRHRVAGETVIALCDGESGNVAQIGLREWVLLSCADGTRDIDGIIAAAVIRGRHAAREQVASFMEALDAAGMLAQGPPPDSVPAEPVAGDRPVRQLPDFRLNCDGHGTCCRLYPTTVFASAEVARARALAPTVLSGGDDAALVFTPERGGCALGWQSSAVTMVDGRCAYLSASLRCVLHEAGGAAAKPLGCRLFPARFVDDGEAIRVWPAPECACVLAGGADDGELLVRQDVRSAADLDARVYVERLPQRISVCGDRSWSRDRYRRWATSVAPAAREDAARWLLSRSTELAQSCGGAPPDPSKTIAQLPLREALERAVGRNGWRHADDLAARIPRWMLAASHQMGTIDEELSRPLETAAACAEHIYLRATAFGHGWALDDEPLADALHARALRLLVARRLPEVYDGALGDPALAQPLALVEACCRGFGIG